MATDTAVPTSTDPGAEQPGAPQVDVAALTEVLDGRYAEVARLVRENLRDHASVLEDAETMSQADFRDRVRDVVVDMAATGATGLGFPVEHGGGGDMGASVAAFETLASGTCRCWSRWASSSGCSAARSSSSAPRTTTRSAARDHPRRGDGLLRDDRDRPRLERPGGRHRRDLRRGPRSS